ncbi:carbohydrate ABC transporter membrane protein 2 (CUT1 family) [Paenibacillus cellulosilyticus]|uniref:Carbohydrate ABC transporter membrane protein 2 (CUT1 family) n=1 Tax=Paenibacillus cellulosilyticus TaxID=375489 RepID=A0A2V2YQJ7_9BACL|nr:carbohydrate ABC transporter permease [Paenibacillus cellulosilyticus]PWV99317.1 carbohydrate ABC transporter membrane protein 2 (CUT1 family) [Paenibacillus cellulosilyticus]QKS45082.1 carbohydrate ABC transporter permease [Paenibacillus cellulosilyticus]
MNAKQRVGSDKIFDVLNLFIMLLILLSVAYPLYFIVIASVSNPDQVSSGNVLLLPRHVTFEGYIRLFADAGLWLGYLNSIQYAVIGTLLSTSLTLCGGYVLSRHDLDGRSILSLFVVLTMFFSGGIIPTYLVVKDLGMTNTMWALIIPNAVSAFHLIIARTFFETNIPKELLEASQVEGSSDFRFFTRIVLPLSRPIIAVLALFSIASLWNSYFPALIYLRDRSLYPLQLILREMLIMNEVQQGAAIDADDLADMQRLAGLMKNAVIIVSSLPMLMIYPFVQKHFVKGMMIGSIKN